ncbi:ComEC/Rec2 family competence protein [Pediococcus siamensis]|uniref:ComEC/Rec2 family competence protein n=1 Tax=Pediococcus siamensis TaxID=381829 RepID=UPI0039A17062
MPWVFITILVVLLDAILTLHLWIFILFLGYWLIRIIYLHDKVIVGYALVGGVVFSGLFLWHDARLTTQRLTPRTDWQTQLLVQPDEIKCQGDYFQFTGRNLKRQPLLVSGYFKTQREQQQMMRIKTPVVITLRGDLQTIDKPGNRNQFDYRAYCLSKGITNSVGKAVIINWRPISFGVSFSHVLALLHTWRNEMRFYCEKLPGLMKTYALSLLIGYKDEFFAEDMTGVTKLGLLHLFSLSGLHVFYFCWLLKQIFLRFRITKETTNWLLIILLPAFLIIGGGSGSLFRSIMMAELGMLGKKRQVQLNVWSITLLVNLAVDPYVILSMGGQQLSYLLSFLLIFVRNYV